MNSKIENMKELLNNASKELEQKIIAYDKTGRSKFNFLNLYCFIIQWFVLNFSEKEHIGILEAFGLESLIYKIPVELFIQVISIL